MDGSTIAIHTRNSSHTERRRGWKRACDSLTYVQHLSRMGEELPFYLIMIRIQAKSRVQRHIRQGGTCLFASHVVAIPRIARTPNHGSFDQRHGSPNVVKSDDCAGFARALAPHQSPMGAHAPARCDLHGSLAGPSSDLDLWWC